MKARVVLVVVTASVLLAACVEPFAPAERLTGPRVLAIRANPVELGPDGSVTLDALVYVPGDAGAPATTWAWSWCPLLGTSSDNYACALTADALSGALFPDAGVVISYDGGTSPQMAFSWPVPPAFLETLCIGGQQGGTVDTADAGDAGPFSRDGGLGPPGDGGDVDAGTDAGAGGDDAGLNADGGPDGGSAAIRLPCTNSSLSLTLLLAVGVGDRQLSATRTLTASFQPPTTVNHNPSIATLSAALDGGTAIASGGQLIAGQTYTLTAAVPLTASDRYPQTVFLAADGGDDGGADAGDDAGTGAARGIRVTVTGVEGLNIAWYIEAGSLASATTALAPAPLDDAGLDARDYAPLVTNTWTIPAATRGPVKVIAVIRDNRTGVDWLESSFDVQGGTP